MKKIMKFSLVLSLLFAGFYVNSADKDVSALSDLPADGSAERIILEGENIDDLSPLSEMVEVKHLQVSQNQIKDLSPIDGLTNMTGFEANENQISDLTPISGLTNMRHIELSENQITDISSLSEMTDLGLAYDETNSSGEVNITNQEIILPDVEVSEENYSLPNEIVGIDGNTVEYTESNSYVLSEGDNVITNSWEETFTVNGVTGTFTGTVTQTVRCNKTPSLTAPTFTEINVGDYFDPMSGVLAKNYKGGNITSSVVVTGSVDVYTPGFYTLRYNVTSYGYKAKEVVRVVLVNDGSYSVGNKYVIQAFDFEKEAKDVVVTSTAIKADAKVKVYNKSGVVVNENVTVNSGSYTNVSGKYDITFTVSSDTSTRKTIIATVLSDNIPVITAPEFTVVNLGESFDPMSGVYATDVEDGNLTNSILVAGGVNTSVPGFYVVVYRVADSDGNYAGAKRTVLVNDGSFVVGENFVIKANNFAKNVGDVVLTSDAIKADAGVQVFNKEGSLVNEEVIVDPGQYANAVGQYSITFTVANDFTARKTVTATVTGKNIPVISAPDFAEAKIGDVIDPMRKVTASDVEDGDLTSSVVVSGTVDTSKPGFYTLYYTVQDSDGSIATAQQVILVNDGNYDVGYDYVIYATDFTKAISQVNTSDAAIISDASTVVYDKEGYIVNEPVFVAKGNYTNAAGAYSIMLIVESDFNARIEVVGTVVGEHNPVLIAPTFTALNVGAQFNVMDGVSASDVEDGDLTNRIVVTGYVNTSVPGVYPVTYTVEDNEGNTATAQRTVLINNDSYVVGDNFIIKADNFEKKVGEVVVTADAIKKDANVRVFNKDGELVDEEVMVNYGTYAASEGKYNITFTVASDTTAKKTIVATVTPNNVPVITAPKFSEAKVGDIIEPMRDVTATDAEDGDLTSSVVVTGSVNTSKAGFYTLYYTVRDSDGFVGTAKQVILVNDGNYDAGYDRVVYAKDFTNTISKVNTSDSAIKTDAGVVVYDKEGNVVSETVFVIKGDYKAVEGIYEIMFIVEGDFNARIKIDATVIEGDDPIIIVPKFTEVNYGENFDPMDGVVARSIYNEDLTDEVVISGEVDTENPGYYSLEYTVEDSKGKTATSSRTVLVHDRSN